MNMKVCKMGLESIWIDYSYGRVRLCAWTGYYLGNLTEHTIEELWHGEKAEAFRQSMLDGSYRFCDCQACPYLANDNLDEMLVEYEVPEYPKYCSLSYEEQCNYICVFCRKEHYVPQIGEAEKIQKIEKEVRKFVDYLDTISTNGVGEVFCSMKTLNLLSEIRTDRKLNVELESNGSLFNRKNWEKISNLGEYNLNVFITLHSFQEDTYQFLSGTNMSVNTVIDNLHFIQELRDKNIINNFEIATVICERNFREMPEFVERCLTEFNPDSIRLRFFFPYGVSERYIEWFYDIRNPYHPYYKEFVKVMEDPIFNNPKVWKWQGNSLSRMGEHPCVMEHKKNIWMSRLLCIEDFEDKLRSYMMKHQYKKISLYGLSNVCKSILNILGNGQTVIDKVYDSNCQENAIYGNISVVRAEEDKLDAEMIVITSVCIDEIKNKLIQLGYDRQVIDFEELLNELIL